MSLIRDEQLVIDFLAPLAQVEPVSLRERVAAEASSTRRLVSYAAIALGAAGLIAVIALIAANHPSAAPKPVKKPTASLGIFADTQGWVTTGGRKIVAVDPSHPTVTHVIADMRGEPLAWSPNGSELLVAGRQGYIVIHTDGSRTLVASPHGGYLGGASFTNDGRVIYSQQGTIWSVPARGGRRTALTHIPSKEHPQPSDMGFGNGGELSPDGSTVVYGSFAGEGKETWSLWTMSSDGTDQRKVVSYRDVVTRMGDSNWRHSEINSIYPLAWFGDSSGFLIEGLNQRATECAVFAVNADGSHLRHWGPRGICPLRGARSSNGLVALTDSNSFLILNERGDLLRSIPAPAGISAQNLTWQPGKVRLLGPRGLGDVTCPRGTICGDTG